MPKPKQPTILLAEDDPAMQQLIRLIMEDIGYRVDAVGDGQQALAALRRRFYDLILMDVHMPVLNGPDAVYRIRQHYAGRTQPYIIALSASHASRARDHCRHAGMDDYLLKPVAPEALATAVERYRQYIKRVATAEVPACPKANPPQPAPSARTNPMLLDPSALKKLKNGLGDNPGHLTAFIDAVLRNAPKRFREMRQGLAQEDAKKLFIAAHSLKSNCAALGAARLSGLCKELEASARQERFTGLAERIAQAESVFAELKIALKAVRNQDS